MAAAAHLNCCLEHLIYMMQLPCMGSCPHAQLCPAVQTATCLSAAAQTRLPIAAAMSVLVPTAVAAQKGDAATKLAISDLNSPAIYVYDVSSGSETPVATLDKLHTAPVKVMRFNAPANTVISSDQKGGSHAHCSPGLEEDGVRLL